MTRTPPLLEMRGIAKSFPGVKALRGVDLELHAGEVLALLGENGAGKSTLMRILGGAHRADEGVILLDGAEVCFTSPQDSRAAGIAVIYQEFNLVPGLTAVENIFLGRETTRAGLVDRRSEHERATALFRRLGAEVDLEIPCRRLTTAQQQLVEIAKALAFDARILVMDEPSAALTAHEVGRLFEMIRDLSAHGISIVYISHRLDEVFEITDRVSVLRDGRNAGGRATSEITRTQMIELMVGRELTEEFPRRSTVPGETRLEVSGLRRGRAVRDVSFSVRRGEILGLQIVVGLDLRSGGVDEAIGSQHPEERSSQSGGNALTHHGGTGIDDGHRMNDPQNGRDNPQTRQRVTHKLQQMNRFTQFFIMGIHGHLHEGLELFRLDAPVNQRLESVGQKLQPAVVVGERRELRKDRALLGIHDVIFQSDQTVTTGGVIKLILELEQLFDVLFLHVPALEHADYGSDQGLDPGRIGGDQNHPEGQAP